MGNGRGETAVQFQAILQTIRDQGERYASSLDSLTVEIRDLSKAIAKNQGVGAAAKNGGPWAYLIASFGIFVALFSPLGIGLGVLYQNIGILQREVSTELKEVGKDLSAVSSMQSKHLTSITESVARLDGALIESETQFSCSGDISNVERQATWMVMDLVNQCQQTGGKCRVPARDYWPLANVGRGDGAGRQ